MLHIAANFLYSYLCLVCEYYSINNVFPFSKDSFIYELNFILKKKQPSIAIKLDAIIFKI